MASVNRRQRAALPWCVYLLRCADGTFYAGATNDITRRLIAHGRGSVKYTRGRLPVELAFLEEVGAKSPALRREFALKRLRRREKLALCDGATPWKHTAASPPDSPMRPPVRPPVR